MNRKPQSVQQLSPNKSLNSSRESSKRKRIIPTNSLPNGNRKTESKAGLKSVQPLEPPPPKRSCRRTSQITKTSSNNDDNHKKSCEPKIDSADQLPRNKAEPQPPKPQSSKVLPSDPQPLKRSCRITAHPTRSSNNTRNLKNDVKEDSTDRLAGNKAEGQPVQPPPLKRSYRRIPKKSSNEARSLGNDNNQKEKKFVSKGDLANQQASNKAGPKPLKFQSSDVQPLEPPPPKRSCRKTCPLTKTSSINTKSLQNDDNQKKKCDSKDDSADQLPGNKAGVQPPKPPPPKRSCRKAAHLTKTSSANTKSLRTDDNEKKKYECKGDSADQQPGNKAEPPPPKRSYRRKSHLTQKTSNKQEKRCKSKDEYSAEVSEPQRLQQSLEAQAPKQCNRKTAQPKKASFYDTKSLQIDDNKKKRRETIDVSTGRLLRNKAGKYMYLDLSE
ncbi:nucleolar and coiled-body phosphoprotein 1-like [Drosophila novamexicana]|uniref:nucleolar and coiled-body phosphoprotein 1-like n=1 Tax=Drosophila novamexicana TaxID=47314 RepID=UPI0011E5BF6A|nr:nucleolar and coiled-body phosphoprotein 1-like [Drosophila novamexicana]